MPLLEKDFHNPLFPPLAHPEMYQLSKYKKGEDSFKEKQKNINVLTDIDKQNNSK